MHCRAADAYLGIRGVVWGKKVITINPDTSLPCPDDKVNRLFMADRPNKLRVLRLYLYPHMVRDGLCCLRD